MTTNTKQNRRDDNDTNERIDFATPHLRSGVDGHFAGAVPASANVLFTNLGSDPTNAYDTSSFWNVCGSGSMAPACSSGSSTIAAEFTVAGLGDQPVTQIDLAVSNVFGADTFMVQIFNDLNGAQGSQVLNAYWTVSTSLAAGDCCGLISINNISNVVLTGGLKYFISVGPTGGTDDSWNAWADNNQNVAGLVLAGSSTTVQASAAFLPAFDVVSSASAVPEPGTWLLLLTGAAMLSGSAASSSTQSPAALTRLARPARHDAISVTIVTEILRIRCPARILGSSPHLSEAENRRVSHFSPIDWQEC